MGPWSPESSREPDSAEKIAESAVRHKARESGWWHGGVTTRTKAATELPREPGAAFVRGIVMAVGRPADQPMCVVATKPWKTPLVSE
jgi:hypothetical protein